MPKVPNYNPSPGQMTPEKYAFIGNNYKKYGEQPGFRYDPYTDQYYADRRTPEQKKLDEEGPPKPPGLIDTLAPIAGVGGSIYLGKELGKGLGGQISGMFGSGAATEAPALGEAVTGATGATQGAASVAGAGAGAGEAAGALGAGGEVAATGMFDLAGAGAAGNLLLPAAGVIGGADILMNDRGPVRGGIQGAASGAAIGSFFGPPGIAIGAGVGGLIGLGKGLFGDDVSVKDQVKERWGGLAKSSDPTTQSYAKQYLDYVNSPGQGEGPTFDELKESGQLKPEHVWGGYDMFKVYGSDWLGKYSEDQRRRISQALIDSNLLKSSKGDIRITDAAKAKEIADNIVKSPAPAAGAAATGMMEPPRTSTRSPGIGMDGKPINLSGQNLWQR